MQYNIGDLVVRNFKGELIWDMIGVITDKKPSPFNGEPYYTIKWLDNSNPYVTTWQANEIELVETAKKL